MLNRCQALQFKLDPAVIVVVEVFDQFGLEVFQGIKVLEIQELRFEQTEEILHHSIVQTVAFTAHALPDTFSI